MFWLWRNLQVAGRVLCAGLTTDTDCARSKVKQKCWGFAVWSNTSLLLSPPKHPHNSLAHIHLVSRVPGTTWKSSPLSLIIRTKRTSATAHMNIALPAISDSLLLPTLPYFCSDEMSIHACESQAEHFCFPMNIAFILFSLKSSMKNSVSNKDRYTCQRTANFPMPPHTLLWVNQERDEELVLAS